MKRIKKIVAMIMSVVMMIGSVAISVSAADRPPIWDNEDFQIRGSAIPGTSNSISLPTQSGSFSYSFSGNSTQYSDFVFSPITSTTNAKLIYKATSNTHNLKLEVIRYDTRQSVFSETITVVKGFEEEIWVDFTYLQMNKGYYLKLTNPSITGASGTFTITA